MRINYSFFKFMLIPVLAPIILTARAQATNLITLNTSEREPYIGENLNEKGYVHELVVTVFKHAGFETTINFFPLARARLMAEQGEVDGFFPVYSDKLFEHDFVLSAPFPGDTNVIIKRKDFQIPFELANTEEVTETLLSLQGFKFGLIRASQIDRVTQRYSFLKREYAANAEQNIDKLAARRVEFSLMDKFTASDTMVLSRPHLIGELELIDGFQIKNDFHIAFSRSSKNIDYVNKAFNRALAQLERDGTLKRIREKHGLFANKDAVKNQKTLTIGSVDNHDMLVMKQLSAEYQAQHPEIRLEWRVLDEGTLRRRLLSDLAISDGQFDIMNIGAYEAPIWAERGWLAPIKNLHENYKISDIFKSVRDALSLDGQLYALPFYAESSMMFYRKDLFDSADLTMPAQPTYQEVTAFAQALHKPEQGLYGICLRGKAGWGENMALVTTMVNTFGGRWFDKNWYPELESKPWRDAVNTYKNLLVNYGPPKPTKNGFNENLKLFANGQCGMWIDATVAAGMLFDPKISKVHNNLGFAPAPLGTTDKGAHWLWTWALAIPKSSQNQQEALDFITWATSQDYIKSVAKRNGWVSVPPGTRSSTYSNDNYIKAAPFASFVLQAIQSADPINSTSKPKLYTGIQFVGIPEFPAIGQHVGTQVSNVIEQRVSVKQALNKAQKWVDSQMRKSGYYEKRRAKKP